MSFTSPSWLLALLPWLAVVALLLWGRLKRVKVPFLPLWQGPEAHPRQRRALELPPAPFLFGMLAMLLAILAAARPTLRTSSLPGPSITLLVDRGLTMSARGQTDARFRETVELARVPIANTLSPSSITLQAIPGTTPLSTDRDHWPALAKSFAPSFLDTREPLRNAILQHLANSPDPIVVLSDHDLAITNPRLVQIPPTTSLQNVGIVSLAVRESPTPQLMLRLRNQSAQTQARLRILSDQQSPLLLPITLPPSDTRDYFVDLPHLGPIIQVHLDVSDDLSADNEGYLVRQQAWPILEAQSPLPTELHRIIDLYGKLRPPSDTSKHVAIVASTAQLPAAQPGAVLASGTQLLPPIDSVQVADHPVTKSISDWTTLLNSSSIAPFPDEPGWRPIVQTKDQVLVAIRDEPARAVWVGFHSQQWATRPEFVLFWTNVFNWLGQGAELYTWQSVRGGPERLTAVVGGSAGGSPEVGQGPGVYHRPDETLLAINAFDVSIPPLPQTPWSQTLAQIARTNQPAHANKPLAPFLLLAALFCLLAAALTARRPNPIPTIPSSATT